MKSEDYINYLKNITLGVEKTATDLVLTVDLAAELCRETYKNALSLANDAQTLYTAGRKSTACAIAILAIEEFGKMDIIRQIFNSRNEPSELKKLWKEFRGHRAKNKNWVIPYLKMNNASDDDVKNILTNKSNSSSFFNDLKMSCFYVDISNKGEITSSNKIIDEVFDETINTLTLHVNHKPFNLYSKEYFEVLEKFLFIDKRPLNLMELYYELYLAKVMDENQYFNIINSKHNL